MATYVPTPSMSRPRAHTETGSPATLVPGQFAPTQRTPVRAQVPPVHGHRTVSASVMDNGSRGYAVPPSPGIANPMMTLPLPPPNGHSIPPPPPLKDHPQHAQTWSSWGKAHGGPQWTPAGPYQPQPQQQNQMHLQAQTPYIPHQQIIYGNSVHQGAVPQSQNLDVSSERSYQQSNDSQEFLVNPRSILAANQSQTATISRHSNVSGLQSPSISSSSISISPDIGQAWTLERVVNYLERNGFSREWQEAFRNLNIHGMEFLEFGQRFSPRLQQMVLPEVARLYGPKADQERENKAAKSLKKLIREMLNLGANAPAVPSTPPLAGVGPMSPGFFDKGSRRQGKPGVARRSLSDVYDAAATQADFNPRGSTEFQQPRASSDQPVPTRRTEVTKAAMGNINGGRGPSPSNTGDAVQNHPYGPYVPPGSRSIQESPQSSPSPSFYPPGRHAKTNSQESVASSGPQSSKQGKEVKGRASGRPNTSHTNEGKESVSKFGGKMMSAFFPRRNKNRDEDYHDDIDSPTSPLFRHPPNLPFIHEHNVSDSSIATASTISEHDRSKRMPGQGQRQVSGAIPERPTIRVFATTNLKMFALVDLTELETADGIRKALCMSLGIQDWDNATIYHTEVGQTEHEECLTDNMLLISRRHADDKATVKFYLQPYSQANTISSVSSPPSTVTNTSSTDGPRQLYPVVNRKPPPPAVDPKRRQSRTSNFVPQPIAVSQQPEKPQGGDSLDDLLGLLNDFRTRQDAGGPTAPKIDITAPLNPPTAPMPSMQQSPNDASPDAELIVYPQGTHGWDDYESGLKAQSRSLSEPADFNPDHRPSSSGPQDELFFETSASTYLSTTEQQTSGFKLAAENYQMNRLEEQKRRKNQGLRLQQQQALEKNTGFVKINSPENNKKIIDFDNPRASPFEDKSFDNMIPHSLVPHRHPPPPPPEASHRNSISSLTRKGEETFKKQIAETYGYVGSIPRRNSVLRKETREHGTMRKAVPRAHAEPTQAHQRRSSELGGVPIQEQNEEASRVNQEQGTTGPIIFDGGSAPTSPESSGTYASPGYSWGNSQQFTTPNYVPEADQSTGKLSITIPSQTVTAPSAPVSPGDNSGTRRNFDDLPFDEVQFTQTPVIPQEDEVEESDEDDGLFAIPLERGDKGKTKDNGAVQSENRNSAQETNSGRPALTVATKGVTFRTPTSSAVGGSSTPTSLNNEFRQGDDRGPIYSPTTIAPSPRSAGPAHSPADYPIDRRNSFVRDDVWASRPPPETLIDHLDELFRNYDLDQPIIDDAALMTSPPPSPSPISEKPRYNMSSSALPMPGDDLPMVHAVAEEDEDNSSQAAVVENTTLKAPRPPSVAQRNMNRSGGGLGRMKSIREVARGAHERGKRFNQPNAAAPAPPTAMDVQKQAMLRRKSTKLFGARLIEVKPGQGKRQMQQMQMQDTPPQSQWPKRQATFRWFKGPLIGKGTYGRVYLGMNATTGDFLAVKQVEVNKSASNGDSELLKEMISALNQEIETMQHLDHINIVQYLGCERKEYSISIFLEYISGGSIGSCLRRHGKFEENIVRSLTRQTLSGLEYLHSQGILHRDLKADNILLDENGICKISDFGISKKSENIYGNDPGNSMQGSVFWMAPEVIRPEGQGYSAKIDIWSLGCVVLEMFAGRRPWSKEEAIGAIYKLGSERIAPPIPDDVAPFISPAAIAFLADCHTIEPSERPTARTLLNEHPFCAFDETFNFLETSLHKMIKTPPQNAGPSTNPGA